MRTLEHAPGPPQELNPPVRVVNDYIAPQPGRHLPQMLLATTLVAVLPLVVSLALRATGVVSGWVSVGLAIAMSLAASTAGSAYWRKRGGHGEVLFSELLLWGWLRSWRQERELANATRLLDLVDAAGTKPDRRDELSVERREQLLRQLAGALEGQDVYLNGHSRRVARHATMIARGMGLASEDVARIRAAAAVHDVGKLLTPKAILNKPGRLTDEEFEVIKRHPVDGAEMVAALGDPELTRIVRHHHERLDGAGYPGRLHGEEIPLGARIIAVADTFDAITSARPYRDAAPHQRAIDILHKEAGTQLDPDAVKSFLAYYSGSRPTVIWAIVTSSVRRVVAWLTGDPASAATISASKVAAATMATATIGAVAAAAPVPVVHHVRPVAATHAVRTRRRGALTTLRGRGVTVTSRTTAPASATRIAPPAPAKLRRGTAHPAAAKRHVNAASARHGHRPAARNGGASGTSGTSAVSPATSSGASSAVNQHPAGASTHANHSTSAGQSQGSSANGNANGHTKPLGNGHGKGLANGHGDSNAGSTGSSSAGKPAPASGTATSPGNSGNQGGTGNQGGNNQGSANASANANGNAKPSANGNGNGNGNATAAVAPVPTPKSQDNGHGAPAIGG